MEARRWARRNLRKYADDTFCFLLYFFSHPARRQIRSIRSSSARVNKNWRFLIAAMSWQFIQSLRRSSDWAIGAAAVLRHWASCRSPKKSATMRRLVPSLKIDSALVRSLRRILLAATQLLRAFSGCVDWRLKMLMRSREIFTSMARPRNGVSERQRATDVFECAPATSFNCTTS